MSVNYLVRAWLGRALQRAQSKQINKHRQGRRRTRPTLEELENRLVPSHVLTVNTTNDTQAVNPENGTGLDGNGNISIRSALQTADAVGSSTSNVFTINVPAGTYDLSLGSLIVGNPNSTDVVLNGTSSAANTVIKQTDGLDEVFNLNPSLASNVQISMANVTITGGVTNQTFGGGGIIDGGSGNSLTLTSVTVTGNTSETYGGGGIEFDGGSLTLTNCTISNNTAGGNGGGVDFEPQNTAGNLTITGTTFTGNSATTEGSSSGQGGALYINGSAGNTYSISSSTFSGNQASVSGGVLANAHGTVLFNFNRVVGNTSPSGAGIVNASAANASVDASNTWWGSSIDPSTVTGLIAGTVTTSPWLVLGASASPVTVAPNGTATLTASFTRNSSGTILSASTLGALIGLPVSFTAGAGTIAPASGTVQSTGQATATYTAGATSGSGTASATVDSGTATADLTITGATGSADLGVTASGPTSVVAGTGGGSNNLTYTVTLQNNGPNSASSVQVTDTLAAPGGVTVSGATSASQGSYNTSTGVWTVGTLANGATATLMLVVSVAPTTASGAVVQESASITASSATDPNSANNTTNTISTTVQTQADLSISNAGPASASAGDASGFMYTLTVTNNGPSANTGGFAVTDTLPANATYQASGSTAGWSANGQALTFTNSTGLASGATQTLLIHVTIASSVPSGTTLQDSGVVSSNGTTDPNSANNTSNTVSTTVVASTNADLFITNAGPSTDVAGDAGYTYTLTVGNNGPSANTGYMVTDTLPTGTTFQASGSTAGLTANGQVLTYSNSGLANSATQTILIHVTVASSAASGTVFQDSATVATTGNADPNSANNTSNTISTMVQTQADLSITDAGPATATAAAAGYTYTLAVTDNGPSANTGGFTVTDTLPTGTTFQTSGSDPGWTVNGQALTYTTSNGLGSGATQMILIHVTVGSSVASGTVLEDSAMVASNGTIDPSSGNNTSNIVSTTVQPIGSHSLTVNTTNDTDAVNPSSGTGLDSNGNISIRSALETADAVGSSASVPFTINIPAGNYNLTLEEFLEVGSATDASLTIAGMGAPGTTVIQQTDDVHRVLLINPSLASNVQIDLTNLVITGGIDTTLGGAGILAGGPGNSLTLNNVIVTGNATTNANGGGISFTDGGNLTLINCTISDNTAAGGNGGGLEYEPAGNAGNLTITGSTFTGNSVNSVRSSGGQGGAVYLNGTAGNTFSISSSTFTANQATTSAGATATGSGGAVANANGTLLFNYNRVVGNTSTSGSGVANASAADASVNATNTWWGSNTNPSSVNGLIAGTVTTSPWLVLGTSASPTSVAPSGTATITASFTTNSSGTVLSASNLGALVGVPVSFAATAGTIAPASVMVQSTGQATATFTAGATPGPATASATVDSGTATANLTISGSSASADLGVTASGPTMVLAGSGSNNLTYTVTIVNNGPDSASSVQVTNALTAPAGVTISGATTVSLGSFNSGAGVWTVGTLANGASATLTLVLNVGSSAAPGAVIQEAASITASSATDPNPANNTSNTVSTTVQGQADLAIGNTDNEYPNAVPGTVITYTVVASNAGPSDDADATVTDTFPGTLSGVTYTAVETGGASGFTASGSGNLGDAVSLPFGSSITYTINATISGTATGTLSDTAVVTALGGVTDPNSANNSATDTDTLTPAVTVNPATLPNGDVGTTYSQTVSALGGTAPYTLTSTGTLPTGVTLGSGGVLSGTPSATGAFTFTIAATDSASPANMGSRTYTVTINAAVAITTTSLANGDVGTAYSQAFAATGGSGSYTFSQTGGTLPGGLTLSSGGVLSGTPTTAASSTFTVTATDTLGGSANHSYMVTINAPVAITPTLPNGDVGTAYSQTVSATGGSGSYSYSETGTLPAGLTWNSGGVLSGTPTTTGNSTFTVMVTDTLGGSASHSYLVAINPAVAVATTALANGDVASAYSQTVAASGGSGTYSYTETGTLPAGLTLSSGGVLSGTPTTTGSSTFTVTATDTLGGSASHSFTVTINAAVAITTASLTNDDVGMSYSHTVSATGGSGSYSYTETGTLPAGLTLSSGGVLSGTPTTAGSSTFTVTATDTLGGSASHTYTVTINAAVAITTTSLANGDVSTAYSQTVAASGGSSAYSFTETGALPAGVTLSSSGVLSGTPTTAGSSTFTVTATDTLGGSASHSYMVTINAAMTITTTTLANGDVGTAYSKSVSASGGSGSYSFTETGTLPAGLTLSSGGVLSGTPTTAGSSTFTVTATDTLGGSASHSYTVTINAAVAITTTSLANGDVSTAYSQTVAASGGSASYSFTETGALPAGVTLSSSGVLSGTPTTAGSSTFTVTATDSLGGSASHSYTVTINAAMAIATTSLANGDVGTAYSQTVTASGGSGSYTFTQTSGTLPAGVTLSSGGVLSGTPTTAGSSTFTVTATDTLGSSANHSFTVTIDAAVAITTTSPANGDVGTAYTQTVTASGGSGSYTFTQTSGTLPAGVTLSSGGVLSGTPTTAGSSTFTVTATDTLGGSASHSYMVTINAAVAIATTSIANGDVGTAYSQTVAASGGSSSYSFTETGTLPAGVTLSSSGVLSGTPTTAGSSTFTVTATDALGGSASHSFTVTINAAVALTTTSLANGDVSTAYSQTVAASGGSGSYTFTQTNGTLPAGVTLSSGGVLSGTPTTAGSSTFTVTATDTLGSSANHSYTVTIDAAVAIATTSLANGDVGTAYSQTVAATGGSGAYTFTQTSGTLPAGVTLSSGGVLSGTPTTAGSSTFTVTATDTLGGSASHSYTVTINAAVAIATTSLANGDVGTAYSQTVAASGGSGSNSFTETGTLPVSVTLSSGGVLSGTPTTAGSSTFTVTATDTLGSSASHSYTVTINAAVAITTTTLANGDVGTAYSKTVTASGGSGSNSFTETGTLPAGVTLSSSGVLSGTPTTAGTSTFTVTATDTLGSSASHSYSVTIDAAVALTTTSLANGDMGTAYSQTVAASGGSASYGFTETGTLPAGVTLSSSGVLAGTPTTAGSSTFTVTATDTLGGSASHSFTVTINAAVAITTTSVANGDVGTAYSQTVAASGGSGSYTFTQTGGTLPAGVTLSSGGVLSGTPTTAGSSTFTVTATDTLGGSASHSSTVTINAAVAITTTNLANGDVGTAYSQTIAAAGGSGSYTFGAGSGMPPGLTLSNGGVLSGTPTTAGVYSFTVFVGDTLGAIASQGYTVTINPALAITTTSLANGDVGTAYSQTVAAAGGSGAYNFTETGTLPAGVTLSSSGVLSGTPTTAGSSTFTVTATDTLGGSANHSYMVTINAAVAITTTSPPNGDVGTAYSQTISASGGSGSYSFTETGTLPAGVTLSSGGVLSGTPTTAGSSTFTVTATDTLSGSANHSYTVTINAAVAIPTTVLANGDIGTAYSQTVAATGGSGTYTFTQTSGTLPAGVTLSSGGVLSGTPTTAGSSTFTVTATDTLGSSANHSYTVTINPAVVITTTTLPNGTQSVAYSQTISATGGSGSYTFTQTGGTLPAGVTLSSGGVLSGTPTMASNSTFTVTATDTLGGSANHTYSVTINGPVVITTATLANGDVGTAYSQTIAAAGGSGTYTFAQTGGTLPGGVTLSSGGILSGTPTTAGSSTFTVTATDTLGASASHGYTVTINGAVAITTTSLANGDVGTASSQTIAAAGGSSTYTFSQTGGTLPTGVTLSSGGVLSGTPPTAGSSTFTVTATDTLGGSASHSYTVTINAAVAITNATLANGDVGTAYSQTVAATGGSGPYAFTQTGGTLPAGVTLSSGGVLSGTPTTAGSSTFTVTATDTLGGSASHTYTVTINAAVAITTTLANGDVGTAYSQTVAATGGSGPYTFTQTGGTLPVGVTLSSGGVLSGTPTTAGSSTFTVTATDTLGGSASHTYTVTINAAVAITTTTLTNGDVGTAYSQTVAATGGSSSYSFTETGTLPAGVTLSSGGVLSGTPTTAGSSTFTVTATDTLGGSASHTYTVTINAAVAITTTSLANGDVGMAYNQTVAATGGSGSYTFNQTGGTLPAGVTLSSGGVLSGTPTTAGSSTFTVTATDTLGGSANHSYTVTINPAVTITTTTVSNGTLSVAYSQTVSATGGSGSYTFSQTGGTLPAGVTLSSGGVLSGTPTTAGSATFTVTATDTLGGSSSHGYSVTINAGSVTHLVVSAQPTATAGTAFSLTVTAEDGNGNTGSAFQGTVALSSSSGADITPTSVTLTNGTATIPVTLTTAGNQTLTAAFPGLTSGTATVSVSAGAFSTYQVAAEGPSTVQAGNSFLVTVQAADAFGNPVTNYNGPATVTATISPTSAAGNFPTTVSIGSSGLGFFLANLQKVGSYTITAANGSFTGSAGPVTVTAGPADQLGFAAQPASTPTGVVLPTVTVQVQDVYGNVVTSDNTDNVTLGIASGPGSFTVGSTTTATVHNGVATFSNLTLVAPGSYTLSEVDPGKYIGPISTAFTVAPLQVVPGSFVGSPSGFSLQFNAPFLVNSTTPVLYGQGFGAGAPAPSVIVTTDPGHLNDTAAMAVGSLVLNTANNELTFIATNTTLQADNGSPVLPDGTYTVILRSSAATDGFQALNRGGGFLDGLGTGTAGSGDFTATFKVTAGAAKDDVVWVPAAADGPGQALNAPGMNQAGGGYPVYLDDSTGHVSNVQLTLNYNPALLTVTGVTGAGFTLLGSSSPGQAVLQYSGPALPAGSQTSLGFITASVPSGTSADPTPYKAKDLLQLSNVALNGGTIPVVTSNGLHLVAYVGNAAGDGFYSSDDAVLITRVALQADVGFAAYPLVDPVIVADTDGDGFIPADAPLQVNEAGVGYPTANLPIPPIPSGVVFQAVANNVDPSVTIPAGLQVGADGTVTVPVNIDDAHPEGSTGLIEAHLALTYDPSVFSVSAADVHLGSVLAAGSGWTVDPTINPVTGQIAIALSSSTPITSSVGGSLVTIDFHEAGTSASSTAINLVASDNPTGQQVVFTELEDAQGTFTLTPALPDGLDAQSSVVTLRTSPQTAPVNLPAPGAPAAIDFQAESLAEDAPATTVPGAPGEGFQANAAAVVLEMSDPGLLAGPTPESDTALVRANLDTAHRAAVVVATSASTVAAPLSGLVFQLASLPTGNAQSSPALPAWQHVADQLFQTLVRGPSSSNDPSLLGLGQDAWERMLPSLLLRSQPAADNFDWFNGEDADIDLNWQGMAEWPAASGSRAQGDAATRPTPPATAQPAAVDCATLDQYFAETMGAADQITDDE